MLSQLATLHFTTMTANSDQPSSWAHVKLYSLRSLKFLTWSHPRRAALRQCPRVLSRLNQLANISFHDIDWHHGQNIVKAHMNESQLNLSRSKLTWVVIAICVSATVSSCVSSHDNAAARVTDTSLHDVNCYARQMMMKNLDLLAFNYFS